jgi:hypothetical protein
LFDLAGGVYELLFPDLTGVRFSWLLRGWVENPEEPDLVGVV